MAKKWSKSLLKEGDDVKWTDWRGEHVGKFTENDNILYVPPPQGEEGSSEWQFVELAKKVKLVKK